MSKRSSGEEELEPGVPAEGGREGGGLGVAFQARKTELGCLVSGKVVQTANERGEVHESLNQGELGWR